MEAHAVHYNSKYKNFAEAANKPDGLAVTGFFIQACGDKDCPEFAKTTEGIRNVQLPNTKTALDSGESRQFMEITVLKNAIYIHDQCYGTNSEHVMSNVHSQ